jgi:hypothetical protein
LRREQIASAMPLQDERLHGDALTVLVPAVQTRTTGREWE